MVKRNVIIFSLITLASGWFGVLLDRILTEQPEGDTIGMGLWLILPLLTALLLRILGHDWKDTGLRLNLKGNIKWYAAAVLIYPIVTLIIVCIGLLFGWLELAKLKIEISFSLLGTAFLLNLGMKLFEELPWRGYLTPKLIELKQKDWQLYIIVGLVWSSWHFAYYMVYLPDSNFENMSRIGTLLFASVIMIIWSVMYVELFRLTKSVWPCVLMHAIEDTLFVNILGLWNSAVVPGKRFLLDLNFGIISILLFLGFGLLLRKIRIQKEKDENRNYIRGSIMGES